MKNQNVSPEEARLSSMLGGALLFLGFKTSSLINLAILGAGGYLLYRGSTRSCAVKRLIDESRGFASSLSDRQDRPSSEVSNSEVDEASWESFPASDSPSFNPGSAS